MQVGIRRRPRPSWIPAFEECFPASGNHRAPVFFDVAQCEVGQAGDDEGLAQIVVHVGRRSADGGRVDICCAEGGRRFGLRGGDAG